jgi:gamma-glutamyltranspeptidase / glutathione hydrolase
VKYKGAVACGHPAVAEAAAEVLDAGGNAFDAIVAAQFSACVAEPVLTSLGGGGYLLAHARGRTPVVYDFFVQTPVRKSKANTEFYPVVADFGDATQEFHIGVGSVATPGTVKGAFAIHQDLCSLPMTELVAPAVAQAKQGVAITATQGYIFDVVSPIYRATEAAREHFLLADGTPPAEGAVFRRPALGDTLHALAEEGESLFYQGEIASRIVEVCRQHGHLSTADLQGYAVQKREPLSFSYRGATVHTNPPPSFGGILIAFALELLSGELTSIPFGSREHLGLLNKAMALTHQGRLDKIVGGEVSLELLNPDYLNRYRQEVVGYARALRGTTHISVIDASGNVAAMTLSNGEGCGTMVPGTGFMLNNMLGEEDINPAGFGQWQEDQRMASMMSPTVVNWSNRCLALGSGGSNRIRSAIMQVMINLIDHGMPLDEAINNPRIHRELDTLNVEAGFAEEAIAPLHSEVSQVERWRDRNLFFGGVHGVETAGERIVAVGDPRRGGVGLVV